MTTPILQRSVRSRSFHATSHVAFYCEMLWVSVWSNLTLQPAVVSAQLQDVANPSCVRTKSRALDQTQSFTHSRATHMQGHRTEPFVMPDLVLRCLPPALRAHCLGKGTSIIALFFACKLSCCGLRSAPRPLPATALVPRASPGRGQQSYPSLLMPCPTKQLLSMRVVRSDLLCLFLALYLHPQQTETPPQTETHPIRSATLRWRRQAAQVAKGAGCTWAGTRTFPRQERTLDCQFNACLRPATSCKTCSARFTLCMCIRSHSSADMAAHPS